MPAWLIQVLVSIAVKFGLPYLMKKFPWIPDSVRLVIEELLAKLQQHDEQKKVIVAEAKQKIQACYGDSCEVK